MSCVYTIEVNGLFYVGSCKDEIKRKYQHDSDIKTSNYKLYVAIRANNNEYTFTVHHYFEGTDEELRQEEQLLMDELQPELNEIRAFNSDDDYKEYHSYYSTNYYQENRIELLQNQKLYYENNKQFVLDYHKKYNDLNKAKISEKAREKYTCECGSYIRIGEKSVHLKSKKHFNYLNAPKL